MASLERVAHRLKLRDLRLLDAVVRWKSMAKAAAHLNLTQPAVSKAIGELEHTLGVRLLDRSRQGIEPTAHGRVLIRRGLAIFDEIRQGLGEIEHLSDPTAGEVRIGATLPMAAGIVPVIVDRLSRRFPRIRISVRETPIGLLPFETPAYRELRERTIDLVLGPTFAGRVDDDLSVEPLFGDTLVVATGRQNRWARRRAVALRDLLGEPWCLPAPDTPAGARCVAAFRANGLEVPRSNVMSLSLHLQLGLLATQRYFTMLPGALMWFCARRYALKALPVDCRVPPVPIGIATLKDRTVSPAARLFIQTAREVAKPLVNAS